MRQTVSLKDELLDEIEGTRQRFLQLLDTIPEENYALPSENPAWSVGDVLFHLTLGPRALAFEMWMLIHANGVFQWELRILPTRAFNRINAWFARRDAHRLSRAGLRKAYENAHAALRSVLKRVREQDFARSVVYPTDFVPELACEVDVERLARYVKVHFEVHSMQIWQP